MTRVRRGRPLGEVSLQALQRLERGPLPVWRIQRELGLTRDDALATVKSLRRGGHVVFGAPAPQPGTVGRAARLVVLARGEPVPAAPTAPLALPRAFFGQGGGDE
jgi:hypothetical protein